MNIGDGYIGAGIGAVVLAFLIIPYFSLLSLAEVRYFISKYCREKSSKLLMMTVLP